MTNREFVTIRASNSHLRPRMHRPYWLSCLNGTKYAIPIDANFDNVAGRAVSTFATGINGENWPLRETTSKRSWMLIFLETTPAVTIS
jgi:hypothetical protein